MSDEAPSPVPVAREAVVEADIPCRTCGYNLRTLSMNARCPECNAGVIDSFARTGLIFADPRWLGRLKTGVTIILWMMVGGVVAYIAGAGVLAATAPRGGPPDPLLLIGVILGFGFGFSAVWLISVWYLTWPEPHGPGRVRRTLLARWVVALNAAPLCALVGVLPTLLRLTSPAPELGPLEIAGILVAYAGSFATSIGQLLLLIHLRQIARRDHKRGLGKLMSFLIWGLVALFAGWILAGLVIAGSALFFARMGSAMPPTTLATSGPALTGLGYTGVPPAFVTTSFSTTAPTTGPAMAPPGFPFGGGFLALILVLGMTLELLGLGWLICAVIALFRFRATFARAIRENVSSAYVWD